VYPLELALASPGEGMTLAADVNLLVCSTICVPEQFSLTLPIGPGYGVDADAAALIAAAAARTPDESGRAVRRARAALDSGAGALTVEIVSAGDVAFRAPDVFPEMGYGAFGAPDIRVSDDGASLRAQFPITGAPSLGEPLSLTIVDGATLATVPAQIVDAAPPPPFDQAAPPIDWAALFGVVGLALLGGLLLNVMPCVLPVLSLKIGAALDAQGRSTRRARTGFLAAAAGVVALMLGLAAILVAARSAGLAVGWGLHFQNPVVVAAIFAVMALFAANLFGLFEIRLPARLNTALATRDGGSSHLADFGSGAFGALLATPCSAPFLGAAVAYALTGGPVEVILVFAALGVGLATPYLVFAAAPGLLRVLPKPGRWMATIKRLLGGAVAIAPQGVQWYMVGV
ncbi:MAG: cytochrome c biogenesis protein CcdA, partial [Pseudomonadota bacterium]